MNRTTFRNTMILISLLLAGVAIAFYYQGKGVQAKIVTQNFSFSALQQELENVARLSSALTELDQMTIDEKSATQLNLLRHLNIEQKDYKFQVISRQTLTLGQTQVFSRQVELRTEIPYSSTLKLMDDLYNTKKLQIYSITLEPSTRGDQSVKMALLGNLYGLEKNTSATEVTP